MSAQHTQATLSVWENPYEANSFQLRGDVHWLLSVRHNGEQIMDVQRENMRRLAACWNACDGIPTEALEKGRMSPDAFEANESRADKAEALVDKLLDALKLAAKINPFGSVENAKARDAAIAAIANVEASEE